MTCEQSGHLTIKPSGTRLAFAFGAAAIGLRAFLNQAIRVSLSAMNTRRQFLIRAPLGFLTAASACDRSVRSTDAQSPPSTPGAPPTFGTGAGSGPAVSPATFAEAEKLMQVTLTPAERQQAADTWRTSLAQYLE